MSGLAIAAEGHVEIQYIASLYYFGSELHKREIHFVVCWNDEIHRRHVNEVYSSKGAILGLSHIVEFEEDRITLDIPMNGVEVGGGWKITPIFYPTILKKHVDWFRPRQRIPHCHLNAENDKIFALKLFHRVKLVGAKDPYNFITINLDPQRTLLGSSAQPVSTALQQLMGKHQLTNSQINGEIQQEDVSYLAACFDHVEYYVDALGLSPCEQSDVIEKANTHIHVAMIMCLKIWKRKKLSQATFRALLEMVVKLKKELIADQICQYLKASQSTGDQSPPVYPQPQGLFNELQTLQLSEHTLLPQDEIDALQKLIEGTEVNIDAIIATGQGITLEEAQQLLAEKGFIENSRNLKTRLKEIAKEQQRYLEILKQLMTAADTIDLCYLKLFLVGPPFVGKTTTLSRLLKIFENIQSAGDKANLQSTLLANCIQAFAFVDDDTAEWQSSNDIDGEAKMLFNYFCGFKQIAPLATPLSDELSEKQPRTQSHIQQYEPPTHNSQDKRISDIVSRFQKLIKSGEYSKFFNALGTFLNIYDIGGQPGFLEMLPALSTGPAMYLVFLDLSKELNMSYKIPFSRDDTIITPYDAIHTVKDTVSQILSSISSIHSNPQVTSSFKTDTFSEKLDSFRQIGPLAALIGTHKDKLDNPEEKIKEKIQDLEDMVQKFDEVVICPSASSSLFTVDNYSGTEQSDIAPLRKWLSEIFHTRFKNASLPIRPKWLLFGLILRREYKIASIEDCLQLGKKLEMDENETKFCLRYLHDCVGSVMYYTNIPNDNENWLKSRVICSPQVLFDSISQLIVPSLRVLHSGGTVTEYEREELIRKGQYSAKAIEMYCKTAQVSKKLGNNELIPAKVLITLLQHLNLLSEIVHIDVNDPSNSRITYLMPAILECASQDELSNPPKPDANNPDLLLITFSCGYVPTGAFCGLITRLVSRGPHGILGLTWELVKDGVKRNCVSFLVAKSNKVTLLAHNHCYEIRVNRLLDRISLHDLCAYILSVMLYTLKSLYPYLIPKIAFRCPCPGHISSIANLCVLSEDFLTVQFLCGSKPVTPREDQQVWLGKTVSIGQSACLGVLQFIKGQSLERFSFHWSQVGDDTQLPTHHCKPNILTFQSVSEEDLDYYQCEVKEAGKVVLAAYRALYTHDVLISGAPGQKRPLSVGEMSNPKRMQSTYSREPVSTAIQRLMDKYHVTTAQVNREIQRKDIPFLAAYFDNVGIYIDIMELTLGEQSDVLLKKIDSNHLAMIECLTIWKRRKLSQATFRALLEMLIEMKKEGIAEQICQLLKQV